MSASLSCKFTCQEVWNSLELDGVNICARKMLGREGQQELLSPQPSPVPAGDARAGLVQPNVCPQPDRAASRQQQPKLARREAGAHPGRVLTANPLWGKYWRNRIGFGGTPHTCPPAPACHRFPKYFGALWSLSITFIATTDQHFQTSCCSSPQLPKPACSCPK